MSEGKSLTGRVADPLILELFDGQTDIPYGEIKEKVTELHLSRGGLPETSPTSFPITNSLSRLKKQGKANNPTKGYWSIKSTGIEADISEIDEQKEDILTVGEGKSSVYLYYFPTYRFHAELKEEDVYPCKIGRTDADDLVAYIINQAGTSLPEAPEIGLRIRTDNPVGVERHMHDYLDNVSLRKKDAPGQEWFVTHPEQVLRFYELSRKNIR